MLHRRLIGLLDRWILTGPERLLWRLLTLGLLLKLLLILILELVELLLLGQLYFDLRLLLRL